jgi:hypothetical protein
MPKIVISYLINRLNIVCQLVDHPELLKAPVNQSKRIMGLNQSKRIMGLNQSKRIMGSNTHLIRKLSVTQQVNNIISTFINY